ncbi:hypothetical protein PSCICN_44140 [Pseudomonas cichorii]|uniref:hypothetical protein n=1 Tax=Pseudomonas cichorii TaxID=36746 RepID=UPI0019FD54A8|nr:hypothetical protein [Pseudomonas cichorii]GFM83722.1 hypothetical protein PSCICN_44140 [Pseudomonas cichorii]
MDKPTQDDILPPADKTTALPGQPDISSSLKAPIVPCINTDAITCEQIHAGISIHIPYSPLMQREDLIVFYWGLHQSSTPLLHPLGRSTIVRILCITYNLIPYAQYGPVDIYYEIHRANHLIGTSPLLRVTVNKHAPITPRQRRRKRSMKRRHPGK